MRVEDVINRIDSRVRELDLAIVARQGEIDRARARRRPTREIGDLGTGLNALKYRRDELLMLRHEIVS